MDEDLTAWHQANGYKTYEQARHEWAKDQCAQMAILVSRIIYTDDVNRMFDKLEEATTMRARIIRPVPGPIESSF